MPEQQQKDPPNRPVTDDDLANLADRKIEEIIEEGAPSWTMTFGDMMSLLLCFFILMFSMSDIKLAKFMAAAESMRQGFGQADVEQSDTKQSLPGGQMADSSSVISADAVEEDLETIRKKLQQYIENKDLENKLDVRRDAVGVTLRIQDVVLYKSGQARISKDGMAIIGDLAKIVMAIDYPLAVGGHTDNVPIKTRAFPSNWELSAARAGGVARILVEHGYDPNRLQVQGFAEFKPIARNDFVQGRALNRRVELVYQRQVVQEQLEDEAQALLEAANAVE